MAGRRGISGQDLLAPVFCFSVTQLAGAGSTDAQGSTDARGGNDARDGFRAQAPVQPLAETPDNGGNRWQPVANGHSFPGTRRP